MKKLLVLPAILGLSGLIYGQNISDNKVNVEYIQLPYIKIDNALIGITWPLALNKILLEIPTNLSFLSQVPEY